MNIPVRPPPGSPPCWPPGFWAGVGLITGVGVRNGVVHTNPLMTHCGGFDGQPAGDIEMHGWHDIAGTCVMHIHGKHEWNAVGHGWHDRCCGCEGGHTTKCDGQPCGVVVGHGWHDTIGGCDGTPPPGHGGHESRCVGGHSGPVEGHGWHETFGGREQKCVGGQAS
jgi:hypothetical protein